MKRHITLVMASALALGACSDNAEEGADKPPEETVEPTDENTAATQDETSEEPAEEETTEEPTEEETTEEPAETTDESADVPSEIVYFYPEDAAAHSRTVEVTEGQAVVTLTRTQDSPHTQMPEEMTFTVPLDKAQSDQILAGASEAWDGDNPSCGSEVSVELSIGGETSVAEHCPGGAITDWMAQADEMIGYNAPYMLPENLNVEYTEDTPSGPGDHYAITDYVVSDASGGPVFDMARSDATDYAFALIMLMTTDEEAEPCDTAAGVNLTVADSAGSTLEEYSFGMCEGEDEPTKAFNEIQRFIPSE